MPPYAPEAMRHLAAPVGVGRMERPDAVGESGAADCGDLVRIQLRIRSGRIADARFLAFGCGAATASASAACERLRGARLERGLHLSAEDLAGALGLTGTRRHGAELVGDAVARAFEDWYSRRLGARGLPLDRRRVAVAMSGGVDSAVAAMLLRDRGYAPVGVTMRLWHDPGAAAAERSCCSPETVQLARASAHALGIPHVVIDAAERFRRGVVEDFVAGYAAGRTPNPCVTCNGRVRFAILAEAAALLGARWLATGHYARLDAGGVLAAAADAGKDQSYMLAMLPPALLRRLIFPLGDLPKARVRALARAAELPAADAVESQEVCFVGADGYPAFLERTADLTPRPGPILDPDGRRIGTHEGYWRFTVGQRRGLGVASAEALYVLRTDARANAVWVGSRALLSTRELHLDPAIVRGAMGEDALEVRVRYRGRPLPGLAEETPDGLRVTLLEPADGVAPGQTAALYRGGRLVAAGTITVSRQPGEGD